ncbi:MAG: glycosyltransferase [Desulfomicrobium sp.]
MKSNTIVTICVPTYNREQYILNAIQSALSQQDGFFDILIVDDGSTDGTAHIVNAIKNPRLRFIQKPHTNAPDTRNVCIQKAEGDFILWLDSDDILAPDLLPRFRTLIEAYPDTDICYGDIEPFGDVHTYHQKIVTYADYYHKNRELLSGMVYGNKIPNPGTFIRKSIFDTVGLYNTEFRRAHDYEFWVRCAPIAVFKHIGGTSLRWRWHDANMSTENMQYDTSFEAAILTKLITEHSLQTLFPSFEWRNSGLASLLARCEIAKMYLHWKNDTAFMIQIEQGLQSIFPTLLPPERSTERVTFFKKYFENIFTASKNPYFSNMIMLLDRIQPPLPDPTPHAASCQTTPDSPLVSVIIPTFNRPDQLLRAIKSVLEQTFTAFEAVVVNDCGIDVSKLLKTLDDHRIVHLRHEKNKGLAATRNTGIRAARGKYIAYLDDDDEFYPHHLQTLVDTLEGSQFKAAYTDGDKCLYEERDGSLILMQKFVEHSVEFDPIRILIQNYIPVLCMMHEKACLDNIGLFDETMSVHEDWDLWARLSRAIPFKHVKRTTCAYKITLNAQKNMTTTRRLEFVKTMQHIYRKHFRSTKSIPKITEIQHKCLESLTQSFFQQNSRTTITVGDDFNIYIDGQLLK